MRKLLLILALTSLSLFGASFDCTKATTKVEKMICANEKLSKLDEKLSLVFKEALQSTEDKEQLKKEQLSWTKERNRCKDIVCIQTYYKRQIQTLSKIILDNAEAQKLLALGDGYFTSYQQSNKEDDKIKGLEAYKKYVALLRTQNPLPKVPFRVAEEVYLKHKLELPYPDVWGYDFGYSVSEDIQSFNSHHISSVIKLSNNEVAIRDFGTYYLFFNKVKFWMRDDEKLQKYFVNEKRLFDKLHKLIDSEKYIFEETPLPICDGTTLMYDGYDSNAHFETYFSGKFILKKKAKRHEFSFVYRIKEKTSYKWAQKYEDSTETYKVFSDVWDITSHVKNVVVLEDETFIVDLGMVVLRLNSNFESNAPFINQTVFRLDEKNRKTILNARNNEVPFVQAQLNKASEIIEKKIKLGE